MHFEASLPNVPKKERNIYEIYNRVHVVNEATILVKLLSFNKKFPGVLVELGVLVEIHDTKKNLNASHFYTCGLTAQVITLSFDHPLRLSIIQTSFESSSEFRQVPR